jgi:hypothetical protein
MDLLARIADGKINKDTTVLINLGASSDGKNNGKGAVNDARTLEDLGVDLNLVQVAQPQFPEAEVAKIASSKTMTGAEKSAKLAAINDAFGKLSKEFAATKQQTLPEKIRSAVVTFLIKEHKFSKSKDNQGSYVSEDMIQVALIPLNGTFVFNVTGTATWGV